MTKRRTTRLASCVPVALLLCIFCQISSGCGGDNSSTKPKEATLPSVKAERVAVLSRRQLISRRSQLRAVRWRVLGNPIGRRVKVTSQIGYCVGQAEPRYVGARVLRQGKRVEITLYAGRPSGDPGAICRGVGSVLVGIVHLGKDGSSARLYDASVSPPVLRRPK
jgi:hypothetical protein